MVDTRRITQESIEIQVQLDGDSRITQEFAEIILDLTGARITQETVEIIMDSAGVRITQEWIEVIADSRFGSIEPVIIVVDSEPVGALAICD